LGEGGFELKLEAIPIGAHIAALAFFCQSKKWDVAGLLGCTLSDLFRG
jgi:hypothetical protein